MKKTINVFIATFFISTAFSQKLDLAKIYSQKIDTADLKKHLTVLASDGYEGRETGQNGQRLAATYITNSFKKDGCRMAPGMTTYEQFFDVVESTPGGSLMLGKNPLAFKTDFVYFGAKQAITFDNLPVHGMASATKNQPTELALIVELSGMDVRAEVALIRKNQPKGTKAIVLVTKKYADLYEYLEHYATNKTMRLAQDEPKIEVPIIVVRAESLSKKILKSIKVAGALEATLTGKLNTEFKTLQSSNVLAYIPGSDPILAKEIVVITAHYDHIGTVDGVVYNGADDDGTGTVALLEIAEAFMTAKNEGNAPRRSILIMPVSGEEKGLLGSAYYASNPIISLENTIADLNIDMIGRNDIAHEKDSNYIYIIGSNLLSTDLHNANELANNTYTHLKLDYKFNNKTDPNQFYYRSDHYNFAKNNIPSIFYFSGVHEDYHQPTDDIEKINFQKVEKVARLVFYTAWQLANETQRPRLDY